MALLDMKSIYMFVCVCRHHRMRKKKKKVKWTAPNIKKKNKGRKGEFSQFIHNRLFGSTENRHRLTRLLSQMFLTIAFCEVFGSSAVSAPNGDTKQRENGQCFLLLLEPIRKTRRHRKGEIKREMQTTWWAREREMSRKVDLTGWKITFMYTMRKRRKEKKRKIAYVYVYEECTRRIISISTLTIHQRVFARWEGEERGKKQKTKTCGLMNKPSSLQQC